MLPRLPISPLTDVGATYLSTVRAAISEASQLNKTAAAVRAFVEGPVGARLHDRLLRRAEKEPNWFDRSYMITSNHKGLISCGSRPHIIPGATI